MPTPADNRYQQPNSRVMARHQSTPRQVSQLGSQPPSPPWTQAGGDAGDEPQVVPQVPPRRRQHQDPAEPPPGLGYSDDEREL